ncbi:BspA family leucine-rich repeat surface protein [uncultured Algibacter sp.]|uniref:BspA family leucine-rich repeat surface protein n=1 Tax=uncultured Algibacter sp. TaxID=298659 RepID=UPI0030EC1787|tara:strand:+ start:57 stop:680 length:624 start_codon:yes stop_codon:yes gene_type:complete
MGNINFNKNNDMKKITFILYFISILGYSQTPITDDNFYDAIQTCLKTNPVDGLCSNSEYGAMPNWDVSKVTDMSMAFAYYSEPNADIFFNADISSWDVSNVTNMENMFAQSNFNQDISSWDVSNVTNMSGMFASGYKFNQDISSWKVSKVIDMSYMFENAWVFNQDLSSWDVSNVTKCKNFYEVYSDQIPWSLPNRPKLSARCKYQD